MKYILLLATLLLSATSIINSVDGLMVYANKPSVAWATSAAITLLAACSWDVAFNKSKHLISAVFFVALGLTLNAVSGHTTLLGWTAPLEQAGMERTQEKEDAHESRLTAELSQLLALNKQDSEILNLASKKAANAIRPKSNLATVAKKEEAISTRESRIKEINQELSVNNTKRPDNKNTDATLLQKIQAHAADAGSVLCLLFLSVYRRKSRPMSLNVREQWLKLFGSNVNESKVVSRLSPDKFIEAMGRHTLDSPVIKMDKGGHLTNEVIQKLCGVKRRKAETLKKQAFDKGLLYRKPHGKGFIYWHVCYGDRGESAVMVKKDHSIPAKLRAVK